MMIKFNFEIKKKIGKSLNQTDSTFTHHTSELMASMPPNLVDEKKKEINCSQVKL